MGVYHHFGPILHYDHQRADFQAQPIASHSTAYPAARTLTTLMLGAEYGGKKGGKQFADEALHKVGNQPFPKKALSIDSTESGHRKWAPSFTSGFPSTLNEYGARSVTITLPSPPRTLRTTCESNSQNGA
jgi:hypothetical protein